MVASRLGRRSKIIIGAVAVLACLATLASYLYVRYVDVVRFSAGHGRIVVDAAPTGKLDTVLVTNKGFALYVFAPTRPAMSPAPAAARPPGRRC